MEPHYETPDQRSPEKDDAGAPLHPGEQGSTWKTDESAPSAARIASRGPSPAAPAASQRRHRDGRRVLRTLGLGLITGAADDDCSAIGTYAQAGARFGPSVLWMAPVTFPMMVAVVYLSAKLGQVSGRGLFDAIRAHYPRWILYPALVGVMIGNTIEAAANIGGMSAAVNLLVPALPIALVVMLTTAAILALQLFGSYALIRNVFRWLALALLAYVPAALLARPSFRPVLRGTFVPSIHFNRQFLEILVAVIGTTLSAYLYTWQSNQEVEEEIEMGRRRLWQRQGATDEELRQSWWDVVSGMFFSNVVMYFIILSTAATLYYSGKNHIGSAAEAAQSLRPLAGRAAGALFAIGMIGVGFLAVPVMTTGAAYDLCQTFGWRHDLFAKPREAKRFYATIAIFTFLAMGMNFFGINPIKALVFAGIVQGFSTPPLMLLIMLMSNKRAVMGNRVNGLALNVLGWLTTGAVFASTVGLVVSWIVR